MMDIHCLIFFYIGLQKEGWFCFYKQVLMFFHGIYWFYITQKAEKYLKFWKSLKKDFAGFDPSYRMISLTLLK